MESFAVLWSEPGQPVKAGKLVLGPYGLHFEGSGGIRGADPLVHEVYYEDIGAVHVARGGGERLVGRPALVLDRSAGGAVRIGAVDGPGILSELAARLGRLTATRLAV